MHILHLYIFDCALNNIGSQNWHFVQNICFVRFSYTTAIHELYSQITSVLTTNHIVHAQMNPKRQNNFQTTIKIKEIAQNKLQYWFDVIYLDTVIPIIVIKLKNFVNFFISLNSAYNLNISEKRQIGGSFICWVAHFHFS